MLGCAVCIHRYTMGMPDMPSTRPAFPAGSLDLVLLSLIAREPAHGYRLAQLIKEGSKGWLGVEEGSLYPALQRLRKRKLVEADWQTQATGREVRVYWITAAGREALREGTQEWAMMTNAIGKFLDQKIQFALREGGRVRPA